MFFIKFKVSMNIYKRPHVQKTTYACNRVYILFSTSVELHTRIVGWIWNSGSFDIKNRSKNFLDFRHGVRGPKCKKTGRSRFCAKNPKFFL